MLQRIQPLKQLVNEMLDQLPKSVWRSKTTTFLDPAIGGGQFVAEIERRLRAAGHSDENIKSRVFGFEYSLALIDMAINMNKLVGTYKKMLYEDFFKWDTDMKFDVVVGNPPFQDSKAKKVKLWLSFLQTVAPLATQYIAVVTPDLWIDGQNKTAKTARKLIAKYNLQYLNLDTVNYFSVGETICSYIISITDTSLPTKIIGIPGITSLKKYTGKVIHRSDANATSQRICSKMKDFPKAQPLLERFEARRPESMEHYQNASTNNFVNQVFYSSTEKWFTDLDTSKLQGHKIIFNNSGYYFSQKEPNRYMWRDNKGVALGNTFQIRFKTAIEADNALTVFRSKLYVFFVNNTKTGGFNAGALYMLPIIDFSKSWTDQELYTYFNLTKEEIDYIEANVK